MLRAIAAAVCAFGGITGAALAACPGYSACPLLNYPGVIASAPARAWRADIDATEAQAVQQAGADGINFNQLLSLLGQALVFDRTLSFNGTQACAFCHSPATGFSGGLAATARAGGIVPGAFPWRTGLRNPQPLAYAAFAPILSYRPSTQDFAGGAF